uniref:SFRICE_010289 n=1 Tax=Spodoptera frugiperda TaxID=7108 RepID=A0A2H1VY22_SPOFR
MVRSEGDWDAVSFFCEAVMLAKEEAGRVRERTSSRPSRRERQSGRQGPRDDLRPPCANILLGERNCPGQFGFRPRTLCLWNELPAEVFPVGYYMGYFKKELCYEDVIAKL